MLLRGRGRDSGHRRDVRHGLDTGSAGHRRRPCGRFAGIVEFFDLLRLRGVTDLPGVRLPQEQSAGCRRAGA